MNKVVLIGNLTRDPDLAKTTAGIAYCKFTIAVNRPYSGNGENQVDFLNCTAWRGQAENIAKYCKKGSRIAICGSIQTRQYEDNSGVRRTVTEIVAQEVTFLGSSAKQNEEGKGIPQSRTPLQEPEQLGFKPLEDDDLPF